ncbi:MAG: glycosyltransferase family 4 protein [Verrucomicrobiales bacterium]
MISPTQVDNNGLRVLMTADCVGGVWTYAIDLSRELAAFNIKIALAVMGAPLKPEQQREAEQLPNVKLYHSSCKLEWMENPWDDVAASGEWLLQIAEDFQPDIIHLNGYAHGALPWKVPVLMVAHSCVCSWWQAVKGEEAPANWTAYRAAVQRGLRSADLIIAPSESMLSETRRLFGPFENSGVIYNGCDPSRFRKGVKQNIVLSAGRIWDEAKNVKALVNASPAIQWPVWLAGETEDPGGSASALNSPHCQSLGFLTPAQMREWFSKAAIYALPAKYEPFGLSILEAALSGCALVLGDIPSLREIWGHAALYVEPDSPEQLASVIGSLIESPHKVSLMAAAAEKMGRKYSSKIMAATYFQRYHHLRQSMLNQPKEEEVLCGF